MKEAGQGQPNPVDVLRWPGVMAAAEQDMDAVATELLELSFDTRCKSRLRAKLASGEECGLFLVRGTVLRGGFAEARIGDPFNPAFLDDLEQRVAEDVAPRVGNPARWLNRVRRCTKAASTRPNSRDSSAAITMPAPTASPCSQAP